MLVASVLFGSFAQCVRAEIDAEQVRRSIQRGIDYLTSKQKQNGSWPDSPSVPVGISALCTLALLTAGLPPDDPHMRLAIDYLRRQRLGQTYSVSLQTMVLCAAEPKRDLFLIRQNVQWLEAQQIHEGQAKGAWSYGNTRAPASGAVGDNSNAQFALLALHEAERVGVPVKEQTWRLVQNYWKRTQNLDGSWGYKETMPGTGSMTCAGIAALVIADDRLNRGDAEIVNDRVQCCGEQEENPEIERALSWLATHFAIANNPGDNQHLLYYLYGLERVGRLTNQRMIGRHDWYREGADWLVRNQEELSGFWRGVGHGEDDPQVGTSLALLFLSKGRRPVLVAKLKHPPQDDWNHHRTDVANLTGYVEKRWHRDLTWQVIDIRIATADDLNQAPVVFLSGRDEPEFTDEQVSRLREYIDRGGFLFAEDCCNGGGFDAGFRKLMTRVFPEPEYSLHLLPPEHPVWHAEEAVPPAYMPPLLGIDIGCRTSVIYCPKNLGCYWELARSDRETRFAGRIQG
ncbi:MAG TPA: DUF4159 domain-containing protein, partial [Pirellulales bacterium]|nr:DUF4159 domain-containing protein [Pirellulales bacterium]